MNVFYSNGRIVFLLQFQSPIRLYPMHELIDSSWKTISFLQYCLRMIRYHSNWIAIFWYLLKTVYQIMMIFSWFLTDFRIIWIFFSIFCAKFSICVPWLDLYMFRGKVPLKSTYSKMHTRSLIRSSNTSMRPLKLRFLEILK